MLRYLVVGVALALATPSVEAQDPGVPTDETLGAVVMQSEQSEIGLQPLRHAAEPIILEGRIVPHLFLNRLGTRLALEITPKIRLRILDADSEPVRAPSFMPRATLYFWLNREQPPNTPGTFFSVRVSHHSNGQDGDFFNPDGSVNHVDGSFSTNFVEGGVHRSFFPGAGIVVASLSVEQHLGFSQSPELDGRYSMSRVNLRTDYSAPSRFLKEVDLDLALLLGGVEGWDTFDPHRVSAELTLRFAPRWISDATLFAKGYIGQDYYNIRFDQWVALLQLGLSIDFTTWSGIGTP